MQISIRNINKDHITNKELRTACRFFLQELLHPKTIENLVIHIKMFKRMDEKGFTIWLDKPDKPRAFDIALSPKYKRKTTLLTLAHECVHVYQFATGLLKDQTTRSNMRWAKKELDHEKIDYYDAPWEIEAYGREWGLYQKYMDVKYILK